MAQGHSGVSSLLRPCWIITTNQEILVSLDTELSLYCVQVIEPFNTPLLSASLQLSCTRNKWI